MEPGARLPECVRHRRLVHGLERLSEPLAHVHGIHRARGRPCSRRAEAGQRMSDNNLMNRRELLQRVAVLMGGAISAPAVLGILNGCTAKQSASWQPLFLSKEEGAMVEEVAELILPRTTTAGAREVGVPAFIDVILKDAYPSEDQARFISGLKDFDAEAQRAQGKPLLELSQAQRV